jgi:hypothetical protein
LPVALIGQAALTSPTSGSALGTSHVTFTWTAGTGVTKFNLWLGTSGPGSSSLYTSGWVTTTSTTVTSLPAKATTVYARLYSDVDGVIEYNDYTYTESGTPAAMSTPASGTTLGNTDVKFTWTAGYGVTENNLWLGTSGPGSSDLYTSGWVTTTSNTVTSLPAKGVALYARLYSMIGGVVHYNDYTYTEAVTPAAMSTPAPGSTLGTTDVKFTWTAGSGVTEDNLWLGLSGPGSSDLYTSGWVTTTSSTVTSLPAKRATVYARLYSLVNGVTHYNDYTYTEAGSALLSAFSCTNTSMTGSGTNACTVTLSAAAPAGGLSVGLSSNNTAVTVPATVTVAANAISAPLMATVSAVTTAQAVTLGASAGNVSENFALQLNAAVSTLSINATSVGFGNVGLGQTATQTVTLTSVGTASVTVNSAVLTGVGFTLSEPTFPATLIPGQTATLGVKFDPTVLGASAGVLTIVSTSSTDGTTVIPLTGTGTTASSYAVDLSWDAPTSSTDPVAGYKVYRAPSGSSMYQVLNSSVDSQTTYTDSTVQSGQVYDYIVESVDGSGVESVPTSPIAVTIP